ncbi:TRAP transporter substrate-binding protein DctP [Marinobacterium arenosum]|uniref:TRAP transporter substrate-binding protein DctP n=1 Tax=Marinobacterium arenosum TaxID=2862496 RepID=UPI001C9794AE|nr:TRAP transporter substrate-binding protein DctP [Marinobacterium arenosum]MBY4677526.1 TRAP transporter substrate-binding protein DctP [Marinobacterium arenosum]
MFRKSRNTLKSLLCSCTLAAATLTTTVVPTQAAADDSFILAHAYPSEHIFHQTSEKFREQLAKQGSKLEIDYHPGGDLGDWTSLFEQSMEGVIPMTLTFGASEFDGRLDLTWLGYVVDNWDDARKVYGPNGEIQEVYNQILADLDLVALGTIPTGFGSMAIRKGIGKQPTSFPADAKGVKVRVPPVPIAIERFKNWGFTAVPMPYSELYTALQLGTVDGRAFGPAVEIWQMRDVLESYILTRDYFEHAFWLVNKSWYEELPAAERDKLNAAANATLQWVWSEAQSIDEGFLNQVREAGINVVELSPQELKTAKEKLYANEWPFMEKQVGPQIMNKVRAIAGVN